MKKEWNLLTGTVRECAGEIHHQLILFSDEAWLHLSA